VAKRSPTVIDGFASVQAVRRAKQKPKSAKTAPAGKKRAAPATKSRKPAPTPQAKARIGRTAMPAKYHLVCYECRYEFSITGRLQDTICPKCHKLLQVSDHVIESECTRDIRTIGTIEVKPAGCVREARLLARRIILGGTVEACSLQACEGLELRQGADFDGQSVQSNDVTVHKDADVCARGRLLCRSLDVDGSLTANVHTEGIVRIHPGGCLRGEVHTPHLIIEDGAGLVAEVVVRNEKRKSAEGIGNGNEA
jgi:cytoskeletal protein CcmA (bactofilin family)